MNSERASLQPNIVGSIFVAQFIGTLGWISSYSENSWADIDSFKEESWGLHDKLALSWSGTEKNRTRFGFSTFLDVLVRFRMKERLLNCILKCSPSLSLSQ